MSDTTLAGLKRESLDPGGSRGEDAPQASGATLECRDLTKSFVGVRAVAGLNASFEAGRITALVGPNGAGKTTLFHLISGALAPNEGEILLGGRRLDGLPPWLVAQMGVGRLFQDVRVFPRLSVLENLLVAYPRQVGERIWPLFARRGRVAQAEAEYTEEAQHWLSLVGLEGYESEPAEALSYGQQKLVAIARLLAARAEVLLLDEPTAGVNPHLIDRLLKVIHDLVATGRTVVLIEHNMEVVLKAADSVLFMSEGAVVACGTPHELLGDRGIRSTYLSLTPVEDPRPLKTKTLS
jgi:ABC-type branched-subunit amino acid transport system ATPase component